jgi:hypothetical protein
LQADVRNNIGTLDYGEYIRRSATLGINSTSHYEDFVQAKIMYSSATYMRYMRVKHMYVEYMHKYEECMRASAKLLNNGTSEYGECMPTRTFDYEEYIRATETLHLNKVGLYLKEKILGSNEDNYVSE